MPALPIEKPAYQRVADFIEAQGHEAKPGTFHVDSDEVHFIDFKSKGVCYRVELYEDEPELVNLRLAYRISNLTASRETLWRIAHDVGVRNRAVKFEVRESAIIASVEQFFVPPDGFAPIFWRSVSALKRAMQTFLDTCRDQAPRVSEADAQTAAARFLQQFSEDVF